MMAQTAPKITIQVKLQGAEEMRRQLQSLPSRVRRTVLRRAMKTAMEPLVAAAKANAPVMTGLLRRAIGLGKVRFYSASGVVYIAAGVRHGFRRAIVAYRGKTEYMSKESTKMLGPGAQRVENPAKIAHILERGRGPIQAGRGPRSRNPNSKGLYLFGLGVVRRSAKDTDGTHFMERAITSTQGRVFDTLSKEIMAGIEAEANKG